MITDIVSYLSFLTDSKIYSDIGIVILFFISMTPSIMFIPDEVFTLPLVVMGIGWVPLLIVLVAGNFIGYILLYYLGHHADKIIRGKKFEQKKVTHWLHKYKHIVFLLPPYTSIAGDMIMVYAGIRHIPLSSMWWILLPSVISRVLISLAVLYGLISLPF